MKKNFSLIVLFLGFTACQILPLSTAPEPLSILQGATDATSTQINLLISQNKNYEYIVSMDKSVLQTPEISQQDIPKTTWRLVKLFIKDLTSDLTYTLRVYDNNKLIDERFFKVLPKEIETPRIFVISCTSDSYPDLQKKQWAQIHQQKPDLLFLIGDNVYVDVSPLKILTDITENDLWGRYIETRNSLDLFKMKTLIPVYATWDDHDFGINNGDSSFLLKDLSLSIFRHFFPMQNNSLLSHGPGVASSLKLGKNQFLFLDNRTFRSPPKSSPETHFGKEQNHWIFEKVKTHKGPTWLISGDQFFGDYHPFDSFQGQRPKDFKVWITQLKSLKKPLLFVSGDRHLAEIMKIEKEFLGHQTYEITSSGLHSKMFPGSSQKHPNHRALFVKDGESNYLDLKIQSTNDNGVNFETVFWGENEYVFFRNKYSVAR